MPSKRHSAEQIVRKLREAEVELARGANAPNGDLWVLTHRVSNGGPSFDVFDVFSPEGELRGSVAIDESVKPTCSCFAVSEGLLVAAVTDKAGIDRVVAWEIPAGLFQ